MFNFIIKFFKDIAEPLKKIPPGKRAIIFITSVLVMAGFITLIFWAQTPEYRLLFSNLSLEDSSIIIEKLKGEKVNYKLVDNGKAIMVPNNLVYELRLQLAGEGLPQSGGAGFELFDKTVFGMTEFVQKLNYLRGLQGELSRTISQIVEVEQARVHIVIPKDALFKDDQKKATASVVLKLKRGKKLNPGQVQGVVHLVASAVEGLNPSNITLLDVHGNILSGGGDSAPMAKLTANQLDYKNNFEKRLESKVQSMIENILGRGKVIARISADLNFIQEERMEEIYDPDSQVARSEHKDEDTSVGSVLKGGVPGVQSNKPGTGSQGTTSYTTPKSSKSSETRNYEINKITRTVVEPVGTLTRLSIAVAIDGTYDKGEDDEKPKYIPRSENELKKYMELVKSAVGFNAERGDKVEVTNMPFWTEDIWEEAAEIKVDANRRFWIEVIQYILSGLVLVLVILFVLKPIVQWGINPESFAGKYETPDSEFQLEDNKVDITTEKDRKKHYRQQVEEFVKDDPKRTAEYMRKWMRERV